MRSSLLAAAAALLIAGPAGAAQQDPAPAPSPELRACVEHFTEEGSLLKGKTYRTWQEYEGASRVEVLESVAQAVALNSWGHVNVNKDLFIISAAQDVTMGEGSQAPLNIVVKQNDSAVRVEAVFGTGRMQKASTDTVRNELCELVEAPQAE